MINYKILPLSVTETDAFEEASKEELRVLVALIESGGVFESRDALAKKAKTSPARCSAALVLWSEAGVISEVPTDTPTITEEFEERLRRGEIREEKSVNVANSIRNNNLKDMIDECARLMKRSTFSTAEIKDLIALHEQYGLSEEYIVTLTAFLTKSGEEKLSFKRLINKAVSFAEKEIDTPELLTEHIKRIESTTIWETEFRKLFYSYERPLSDNEKEILRKWGEEYGYFTEIISIAANITKESCDKISHYIKYADKIITRWYEAGCRTASECRAKYDSDQAERKAEKKAASTSRKSTKKTAEKEERYGGFDVNDAFMKALERSYGTAETKDENNRKEN